METAKNAPVSNGTQAAQGEQARATYTVVSPLEYGEVVEGKAEARRYEIGDEVDLTEAVAAPLLGHTVVRKPA